MGEGGVCWEGRVRGCRVMFSDKLDRVTQLIPLPQHPSFPHSIVCIQL